MEDKITEKQLGFIQKLYRDSNIVEDKTALLRKFGVEHTNELTKMQASQLIDELSGATKEESRDKKKDEPLERSIIQSLKSEYCVENEEKALALIQNQNKEIVRPFVSPEQALSAWKEYELLKQKIISADDVQKIGDKEFIKKSGWRKLATCFNLSDEIVGEARVGYNDDFSWRIKVKVTAYNGRTSVGVGVCDSKERKFAHKEHDVYATAHTRAKSRAISDMIGGGVVSAEEIDG